MMALMREETTGTGGDDDRALAALAGQGDRAAFAALLDRHYRRIRRVALRWTGNVPDAEDVAQAVCIKLASAIGSFRGEAAFTTWLTRLTINAVQDHHRARAREMRRAEAYAVQALVDGQAAPDPEDKTKALWAAVRQLPHKTRDAVLLVYGEEMSHAQAAQVLGCREATVSWHVHDAKKRLAVLLGQSGDECS